MTAALLELGDWLAELGVTRVVSHQRRHSAAAGLSPINYETALTREAA